LFPSILITIQKNEKGEFVFTTLHLQLENKPILSK